MKKHLLNNEMGAVMIQAIAVVAAVSAISVLVINTIDQLSKNSEFTGFELEKNRAAYQLVKILGSSAACINTFAGVPVNLPNSSAKITSGPDIRDENNIIRYRNCFTAGDCNLATSQGSYIGNGDLRLASTEITGFDSSTNKAIMIFSFFTKNDETPNANTPRKVVRLPLNVYVDGGNNLINCNFGADNPMESICNIFGGTLEGDSALGQEFCKSLFLERLGTDAQNTNTSYKVRGDMQVTGTLSVAGTLAVGSPTGNINAPGSRLTGNGQVDVAGTASVLNTFNVGNDPSTNLSGVGQFDRSLGVSDTAGGVGDLNIGSGNELRVVERITRSGFLRSTNMTSRPNEAVTVGWVKRQIAEAVSTGGEITTV